MKFYLVVYVNTEDSYSVVTKGYYESLVEAEDNLQGHALDHVRCDGGERQEKIALQNEKTLDEIKNDTSLNFGLYLKEVEKDGSKTIEVYEKVVRDTGTWRSYIENFIESKGVFRITDVDFNVPERFSCGCNVKRVSRTTSTSSILIPAPTMTFLDELTKLMNTGGKFNLKPATKRSTQKHKRSNSLEVFSVVDEIKKIAASGKGFGLKSTKGNDDDDDKSSLSAEF